MFEQDSKENPIEAEQTLARGLASYSIGAKLRRLRLRKAMGLVELGRHTSLSPAMLSKIENGKVIPTLPTLLRIALVFSVGLDHFFSDDSARRFSVVRVDDRQDFDEMMDGDQAAYHFQCLDFKAVDRASSAYLAEFEPFVPESTPRHAHVGREFIHVLTGTLGLITEESETMLRPGDSAYFDPSFKHGYRRVGGEPCQAIVVTIP
jgi:transcriptional regulator with XRE-family HTH domain